MHPDDARCRGYSDGFNGRPHNPPTDPECATAYAEGYAQGARRR